MKRQKQKKKRASVWTESKQPIWMNSMRQQEPSLPECAWAGCSCVRRPPAVRCVRARDWTWRRSDGAQSYETSRRVPAGSPGSAASRCRSRLGQWRGLSPTSLQVEERIIVKSQFRRHCSVTSSRFITGDKQSHSVSEGAINNRPDVL